MTFFGKDYPRLYEDMIEDTIPRNAFDRWLHYSEDTYSKKIFIF